VPAVNAAATASTEAETAKLAPDPEATSPKETPEIEASKAETPKAEPPKADAPRIDAVKPEAPRFHGNVTIMSPGERVGAEAKAARAEGSSGKRRFGAMAAVVALATVAGALGGALATAGIAKLMAGEPAVAAVKDDSALEAPALAKIHQVLAAPTQDDQLRRTGWS